MVERGLYAGRDHEKAIDLFYNVFLINQKSINSQKDISLLAIAHGKKSEKGNGAAVLR
jgi:hypothetical protein